MSSNASRYETRLLGVMRRLRAIFAVLGAASGLDGEKARKLHLAVRMMQAMHGARPVHKLEKRQAEKIDNLFAAIVVPQSLAAPGDLGRVLAKPHFWPVRA